MHPIQLDTDCEGPTCLNDNAYELAKAFVPRGDVFFQQVSRYDDILYTFKLRTGYHAGDTLKLILPFFRALGLTNEAAATFSERIQKIHFVPDAVKAASYIASKGIPMFAISTSYAPFAKAVARRLNIPEDHVYCSEFDLDSHPITTEEKARIRELLDEIAHLPLLGPVIIPEMDSGYGDLPEETRSVVERMNHIFWHEISAMHCGRLIHETKLMSSRGKADAVEDSLRRTGRRMADVIYVGDSITDCDALELVRAGGGLAVSFNGNRFAVASAEIAYAGRSAMITALIADVFSRKGKEGVLAMASQWDADQVERLEVDKTLMNELPPFEQMVLGLVTNESRERLTEASERTREELRGEVGRLG